MTETPPTVDAPPVKKSRWVVALATLSTIALAIGNIAPAVVLIFPKPLSYYVQGLGDPDVSINANADDEVLQCDTYTGTASQIEGESLWFANSAGDTYFIKPIDDHHGDTWSVDMTVGGTGDLGARYTIHVFYVTEETDNFLRSIQADSSAETAWRAGELPPIATEGTRVTVQRDPDEDDPQPC